jgi:hypothetical protein
MMTTIERIRSDNPYKADYIEQRLVPAIKEFHPSIRRAYFDDNALPMAQGGRGIYDAQEAQAIREIMGWDTVTKP